MSAWQRIESRGDRHRRDGGNDGGGCKDCPEPGRCLGADPRSRLVERLAAHLGGMVLAAAGKLLHACVGAPASSVGLERIPADRAGGRSLGFGQNLWIDGDRHVSGIGVCGGIAPAPARIGQCLGHA
jgi:hypothetical protein